MNTKRTRLVALILGALVLSASVAMALIPSLIFTNFRGTLHVSQGVPCGGVIDVTTPIADGRMEITPRGSVPADVIGPLPVRFDLTRLQLFMTPFLVHQECLGVTATVAFREIGVRLASAVTFTGEPIGPGQYRFSIPKEQFLIFESVVDNLPARQPQTTYKRPSEDVTGEINLGRHTAQLHIVLASRLHFRVGCVHKRCLIDEVLDGTQTADVSGMTLVPGTDTDHDGVPDLTDNCRLVANGNQSPVSTPVLMPPPDVTLTSCQDHSIGTAHASDVCNDRPVAITNNAPAKFAVGPNLVTWRASDGIDPPVTAGQHVTVAGPDRTPPTVSCMAANPPVGSFKVAASDDCGGTTTLKLGSYSLGNGEVIKVEQTGKPGVRLINTVSNDNIRHFQVGKGDAIIVATDASGNVARATCR
jgi:hypothetical protein